MHDRRPRLTPAIADVRRAVRDAIAAVLPPVPASASASAPASASVPNEGDSGADAAASPRERDEPAVSPSFGTGTGTGTGVGAALVLVALSGGPDSLALAAATAFEAQRAGIRAGAVIVDHGLQPGSADVAARAAAQATGLGLDPVLIRTVGVGAAGGPEAAARDARYAALVAAAAETGAVAVLLGHTLDDQAETVLLGLARGSGATSLRGMSAVAPLPQASIPLPQAVAPHPLPHPVAVAVRPLLGIRRRMTVQFCADSGLDAWDDPHNSDPAYTRVRVRTAVLPMLERELGPGVAEALARTAEQLSEDAEALDHFAGEIIEELAELAEAGISLPVRALEANPAALRQRIIRLAVSAEFGVSLDRGHTLEVARLVTDWHGQGPLDLPGIRVERKGGLIVFAAAT